MNEQLVTYADFEGIMNHLSAEQGWTFTFADELIPVQAVFNNATYAPALLTLAERELQARGIDCELGLVLDHDGESLFGARVSFSVQSKSILLQVWRIIATAMVIQLLQKHGPHFALDDLQFVMGSAYASNLTEPEIE